MSEAALSANSQNQALQSLQQQEITSKGNNDIAAQLFKQYGVQNVLQAVTNAAADFVQSELSALVESMGMPPFMADDAKQQINNIGRSYTSDTPRGAQDGVNKLLQQPSGNGNNKGDDVMTGVMNMVKQSMQDSTEGATSGNSGSGGSGNWLAILARALGQTAGKSLKNMIDLGQQMGGIDSKQNPEKFAEIQAEFQAQAQIFKMFQEAIGTMIKSIGEGMSSVARKQ